MKKNWNSLKMLVLSVSLLLIANGGFAQSKTVIKINPFSSLATTLNFQVEQALGRNMSLQLGGYYGGFRMSFLGGNVRIKYRHFGITPEFRYYLMPANTAAPSGLYGAAYFRYRQIEASFEGTVYDPDINAEIAGDIKALFKVPGGGVLIGYQFLFHDIVALDLFFGPQISSAKVNTTITCSSCNGNESLDLPGFRFGGFGIRTGISLGVAF